MTHTLLHHRVATTHAHPVHHFIVGQHCAKLRTPVHHRLAEIGDAIVHQYFLLLILTHGFPLLGSKREFLALCGVNAFSATLREVADEFLDGLGTLALGAVEGVEHLLKGPLCPMIIMWVTRAHLAVPVEAETDIVELTAVAGDILGSGLGRMLSGLYGVLLSGKAIGIIAHGIKHIESLQPFVAGINVAGDIAQRMTHVQSCSRRIGEHVEHVVLRFAFVFNNMIGLVVDPSLLPFFFNFPEIVLHYLMSDYDFLIGYTNTLQNY